MRPLRLFAFALVACTPFSSAEPGADAGAGTRADAGTPDTSTTGTETPALALDTFSRAVAAGFGTAEVGGTWSLDGTMNAVSVGEGTGKMLMKAGFTTTMHLASVNALDVDARATTASELFGDSASSPYVALVARKNPTDSYGCTARVHTDGELMLTLGRDASGDTIAATSAGILMKRGEQFHLRFIVSGAHPTKLRCKAWKAPFPEPTDWQLDQTDATAEIQIAGGVGMRFYLSGSSTTDTLLRVDDFVVRAPSP